MAILKKLLHTLWGVNDAPAEITPPIECAACVEARAAGKDACSEHRHGRKVRAEVAAAK